jgi:hypothetical protein
MVGGVMTTGQTRHKSRKRRRFQTRHTERQDDFRQDFARLAPGAADRLWPAMIATGSIGAASPPDR